MATLQEIRELAIHYVNGTAPTDYSVDSVAAAYHDAIAEMTSSVAMAMKNRYDIYQIITEAADEYLPKKVLPALAQFAEVKMVGQNEKVMFKRGRLGKNRAKKFLTQVGAAGVYETFRLDTDNFTIGTHAIGGAVHLDFERFLDLADNLPELMEIVNEGLGDALYQEVHKALVAAFTDQGVNRRNRVASNGFDATQMQTLIGTVKTYGTNAIIFATGEFIEAMGPDAIVPAIASAAQAVYHPDDIDAIHNTGKIKIFRGTPIVEIPQSFIDETNSEFVIDPQYAFILPTGGEKVVKFVIEGNTQALEQPGYDGSMQVSIYRKIGCAILTYHNWAIYRNYALANPSAGSAVSVTKILPVGTIYNY